MVFFTEHSQRMFFMIPGSPSSPEIHRCSGTIMIFLSELPELGALPFWVWAGWPPFQTTIRKKGKSKQNKFDMRLISHSYYGIKEGHNLTLTFNLGAVMLRVCTGLEILTDTVANKVTTS